jgi:ketosteroid isomerase-like protein
MSQENVEIVRAIYGEWVRGDFTSIEWAHPEIEFEFADGLTPGTWIGVAAMSDAWREALSAFEGLDVEAEQYLPIDDERVLVLTRNSGRGRTSGFELGQLQTRGANLFTVRQGKVTKLVLYWDRRPALEAAGLAE